MFRHFVMKKKKQREGLAPASSPLFFFPPSPLFLPSLPYTKKIAIFSLEKNRRDWKKKERKSKRERKKFFLSFIFFLPFQPPNRLNRARYPTTHRISCQKKVFVKRGDWLAIEKTKMPFFLLQPNVYPYSILSDSPMTSFFFSLFFAIPRYSLFRWREKENKKVPQRKRKRKKRIVVYQHGSSLHQEAE